MPSRSMGPDELVAALPAPATLPAEGITSVIGPGTGLGVAILDRRGGAVCGDRDRSLAYRLLAARSRGGGARRRAHRPLRPRLGRAGGLGARPHRHLPLPRRRRLGPDKAGLLWEAAIDGADPLRRQGARHPGPLLRRRRRRHRARPRRDGRRDHRRPRQPHRVVCCAAPPSRRASPPRAATARGCSARRCGC